jgi:hypothetical protein
MYTKLYLVPLFLHVLMTLWIGMNSFNARVKALKNGSAKMDLIEANSGEWPKRARLIGNNFDSQFDSPMLWYAVSAIVIALKLVDIVFLALSAMYLLARIGHSIVHIGGNNVPSRARIFLFSFFVIVAMWVWLAVKVAVTSGI